MGPVDMKVRVRFHGMIQDPAQERDFTLELPVGSLLEAALKRVQQVAGLDFFAMLRDEEQALPLLVMVDGQDYRWFGGLAMGLQDGSVIDLIAPIGGGSD